jgi:hypothetical protein
MHGVGPSPLLVEHLPEAFRDFNACRIHLQTSDANGEILDSPSTSDLRRFGALQYPVCENASCDGIDAMLLGQFERSLPTATRKPRPPRLGAAKLIQLMLQLRLARNGWCAFVVHYRPTLGDCMNLTADHLA